MPAERLILETDDLGNLKEVPKLPPNQQFNQNVDSLAPEGKQQKIGKKLGEYR